MKLPFQLFRRKTEPLTHEKAKELIDALAARILAQFGGFIIGSVEEPGTRKGDIALHVNASDSSLAAGLSEVMRFLLSDPNTKDATLTAIVTALQESGAAKAVDLGREDCDCPICTLRRVKDGHTARSKPH